MASHELPSSSRAGKLSTSPEPFMQEHDPLFMLTRGDLQAVAQKQLGRELMSVEIEAVMGTFRKALNWQASVEHSIQASQAEGKIGPVAAGYQREEDNSLEHVPQPLVGVATPEQAERTWFLVYYSLSGSMPVHALAESDASEEAFATLHDLIGQADLLGVSVKTANHVQLGHAEIEIDGVEAALPGQEVAQTPPPDLFAVISVSRDDLAACGFDASQVSDEEMEQLARKMRDDYVGQFFWSSLTLNAEALGFPKRPSLRPSEQLPIEPPRIESASVQPNHSPEPSPDEAQPLIEPAAPTEFRVVYEVSGALRVYTYDCTDARQHALAALQTALAQSNLSLRSSGVIPALEVIATDFEIVAVLDEALQRSGLPEIPEGDKEMEQPLHLVERFWASLRRRAEWLGFPKKP